MAHNNISTHPCSIQMIFNIIQNATNKEVLHCKKISVGVMTHKYTCQTRDGSEYILRIYPKTRSDVLEIETNIILRCKEVGLPVPNIISTSLDGPDIGLKYFVYQKIKGIMLSAYLTGRNEEEINNIGDQLNFIFNKLSSLKTEYFGELKNAYEGTSKNWNEFVENSVKNGRKNFNISDVIPDNKKHAIEMSVINNLVKGFKEESFLIWGDASIDNIIVDESGNIVGIIDFESCLSGPKTCTIGYFINSLNPIIEAHKLLVSNLFKKNMGEISKVYSFSLLRAYRLARYLDRPLPTGKERNKLNDIFPGLKLASCFFINKSDLE